MKRKILFLLTALLIIGSAGIYAYYSYVAEKSNKITIGYNDVDIVEDYDPPEELIPGITFKKQVIARNTGTTESYIRVLAKVSGDPRISQYVSMDFNTEDWEDGQDGYYYFKYSEMPNLTTTPLFNQVSISNEAPAELLKDFDILVYSESVQAEGHKDYHEAWKEFVSDHN